MCDIITRQGLILIDTYNYTLSGRLNDFNKIKTEPIFIFKKIKSNS